MNVTKNYLITFSYDNIALYEGLFLSYKIEEFKKLF